MRGLSVFYLEYNFFQAEQRSPHTGQQLQYAQQHQHPAQQHQQSAQMQHHLQQQMSRYVDRIFRIQTIYTPDV